MVSIPDRGRAGVTIFQLIVVMTLLCIGWVLLFGNCGCGSRGRRSVARNGATAATLADLRRALEAYNADYGAYPGGRGVPLVADSRVFIRCLAAPGPRGMPYYQFRSEDIVAGEFMSPYDRPFYYTCPAGGPGPDGKVHPGLSYCLWTWGAFRDGADAAWEINNWSR